jgi:predicted restriction endonuclease
MKLPKKVSGKVTVKELDKLWSNKVKEKFDNKCFICGKGSPHAHHIFSRGYKSTRWDIENGVALCYYHHFYFAHQKFEEFRDVIIDLIGEEKYDELKLKSKEIFTLTLPEVKSLLNPQE